VVELVRGTVLWIMWLERNKLCFTDKDACSVSVLGRKIISLATYWCSQKGKVDLFKLSLVLPQEVGALLMQVKVILEKEEYLVEDGLVLA
jgi:hypothetical protein